MLLVSVVRFTAVASGSEDVVLRSVGQYFFERVGRAWRIDLVRRDPERRPEAGRMTRQVAVAVVVLLAWVAGSTVGSIRRAPGRGRQHARHRVRAGTRRLHAGCSGRRPVASSRSDRTPGRGQNPLASRADSIT